MAQFDVFENANSRTVKQFPYLLEVQSNLFEVIVIGVSNRITRTDTETLLQALLILLLNNLGNQVRQVRDGYGRHIFGLTKEVGVTH